MLTLIIIAVVIMIVGAIIGAIKTDISAFFHAFTIGIGVGFLAVAPLLASTYLIPPEYTQIESYSYVTEQGDINTITGCFYEKDGVYYKFDLTNKGSWIPFYPPEMIEVELPKNYLSELVEKE